MSRFFSTMFLADLAGSTAVWLMLREGFAFLAPWEVLVLFFLLSALFIFSNTWLHVFPRKVTRFLAWISGLWMGFLYYGFWGLVPFLVSLLIGWAGNFPALPHLAAKGIFLLDILLVCIGFFRALSPRVRDIAVETEKTLSRPFTLVFASDIHFGGLFGLRHGRNLVRDINALRPDAVLLGGDIVDGDLLLVQQEGTLDLLKNIQAPVYAVYGNHDKRMGTGPLERHLLEEQGIKFLADERCGLTDGISLTGMDDYLFGDRKAEFTPEEHAFNIFMEHEPVRIEAAARAGYDLYFAGHTHAGQIFPNRIFTKRLFALDYGAKKFGNMLAVVSSGYGLWGVPLRIGPKSELVRVKIQSRK